MAYKTRTVEARVAAPWRQDSDSSYVDSLGATVECLSVRDIGVAAKFQLEAEQ